MARTPDRCTTPAQRNPAHPGKEEGDPRAGILNPHNPHEKIPAETTTSSGRQHRPENSQPDPG